MNASPAASRRRWAQYFLDKHFHIMLLLFLSFLLTSCGTISTDNPQKAYMHWAGQKPAPDLNIIAGRYWQSGHWTHEYILYLKFRPTNKWWSEFTNQNNLVRDTNSWTQPTDEPKWFTPSTNMLQWTKRGDYQGSHYLQDLATGDCYVYEIQL